MIELLPLHFSILPLLAACREAALPDWILAGGVVRATAWDMLSNMPLAVRHDVDVAYFSPPLEDDDLTASNKLKTILPFNWEAVNQARAHVFHSDIPYLNSRDALFHVCDTSSQIGLRISNQGSLEIVAHELALSDLMNMRVRPRDLRHIPEVRARYERWLVRWPRLVWAEPQQSNAW